jgi:hypothetical protein
LKKALELNATQFMNRDIRISVADPRMSISTFCSRKY